MTTEPKAAQDKPAQDKATVRMQARARRRELITSRDLEADAARLAEHVLALVAAHRDTRSAGGSPDGGVCRVAAYTAYGTEPPTHRLVPALLAAGHEVILPLLLEDRSLDWTRSGLPLGASAISTAGVIITPGLAVDRRRTRLGQGGGSYDRALLRRRPDALVLTLLHDGELREDPLPHDAHDQPVDGVVTPDAGWLDLR